MQYIANRTKGESLETNIALILNNAKVGAGVAASYSIL
ncbi:pseudouridine-5'-phosphate glycosidase [Ferruginibacter sp.]